MDASPDTWFNVDLGLMNLDTKKSSSLCREYIFELRRPEPITRSRPRPDFKKKVR